MLETGSELNHHSLRGPNTDDALSVFDFSSLRSFLRCYAEEKKKYSSTWSIGRWSKSLKLANTASLSRIIQGTRDPGKEILEKLCKYFDFSELEKEYFLNLATLEKVKEDARLSILVMERMKDIHPEKKFLLVDAKSFEAIANWHFYAIREMVNLKNFKEDGAWISSKLRFKINSKNATQAIATLLDLGLLKRNAKGKLFQSEPKVETANDIASEASKRNHEQNLDNAKWALRNIPLDEREFGSNCMTLSSERIPEAKKLLRDFRQKFQDLFEATPGKGDVTCQLQFQFFPFTHLDREDRK